MFCKRHGKKFRLLFEDEASFGRTNKPRACWAEKGTRPVVPCQRVREYKYAFGAVSPKDGDIVSLVLPDCTTECMNIFLEEIGNKYKDEEILLVLDNASWHKSKDLNVPKNIEIYPLLPYTPELNPTESIWEEIREKFFKNDFFQTLDKVIDRLCEGLNHLAENKETVSSITGYNWILDMLN